jgi:hypothetical protein
MAAFAEFHRTSLEQRLHGWLQNQPRFSSSFNHTSMDSLQDEDLQQNQTHEAVESTSPDATARATSVEH